MIINLGCGNEKFGDVRVDFVKTKTTTHILDLNKKVPFRNGTFSEVYCKSVLEHIGNVKMFVGEIKRLLKEDGKFWIRTDNASYIMYHLRDHQDYIKEGKYNWKKSKKDKHYYLFKKEHLKAIFGDFKDLEIEYTVPNNKLIGFPKKYKCFHIEIRGRK